VDSIEALDAGATVQFGTTFDGAAPIANQWVSAPGEQIGARIPGTKMIMTGGTLDLNNDPKNEVVRVPDGFGLIINRGSSVQAGLNVIMDGLNHTFSGLIADGNNGVLTGDNFGAGATPQGPGYQIGIVSISGTAGSTWTLAGDNTYSGSTRIDGGTIVKLAGNHSLGTPTLTGSLTGPLRIQGFPNALDLNGRNQTLALMTGGDLNGRIYNSAVGTVSTLTVGYGLEQANRNAPYKLMDNTGVGGILAFRKINTQPYALIQSNITTFVVNSNWITTCVQGLSSTCEATYSGDTSIEGGTLNVQGTTAISPNSAYRINTTGAFGPGVLKLSYTGNANCRQLWINGVQQPNGTYAHIGNGLGATGVAGIDPTGTGTITVTGFAPATLGVTQSGNNLNFSWAGVYKLQSSTNNVLGPYSDYVGAGLNAATVPVNRSVGAVYFRLVTY
jgi:autotransporter-associated beta strand protein